MALLGCIDETHIVTEPLDVGASRQHDAFDAPGEDASQRPDREWIGAMGITVGRLGCAAIGAHVEHATRAERDLGLAGSNTSLANERCLLIADECGDWRAARERCGMSDHAC